MTKIDIAGLKIDAISKAELLKRISERLDANQKTFITTPYSEFLYRILWSPGDLKNLNQADYAVADGIGILWAAKYFSLPLKANAYWLKVLQAAWQAFYSLLMIVFAPRLLRTILPEKIVGADLVWDLAGLAEKTGRSVYFLGGFGDTPHLAAEKLAKTYPKLKLAGYSSKNPGDLSILSDLIAAKPDLLFVAFGPIIQERWIAENLSKIPCLLAIGLGGTFDYLAGKKPLPPKIIRYSGLEWLWRLFTQRGRAVRIWQATWGTVSMCVKHKIFSTLPYRQNVVSVIINPDGKVFIGRFNPAHPIKKIFPLSGEKNFLSRWQFPQGGVEPGENLVEAARREAREETGIKNLEFLKISEQDFTYQWPADHALFTSPRFLYRGQKQQLVYFKFTGQEKEVGIDHKEFVEFRWARPEELAGTLHEAKAGLVNIALRDLKEMSEKGII